MCGIAGWMEHEARMADRTRILGEMSRTLERRGPDENGIYINGDVALIHRRLAVIDKENGKQPMAARHEDCTYVMVYNGELFDLPACQALQADYPLMPMMLGRGLLANPALPRQLRGGAALTVEEIARYHDALEQEYSRIFPKDQVHCKMRGIMKHVACCFERPEKMMKLIAKTNPYTYHAAVEKLLQAPLREAPGFVP